MYRKDNYKLQLLSTSKGGIAALSVITSHPMGGEYKWTTWSMNLQQEICATETCIVAARVYQTEDFPVLLGGTPNMLPPY